MHARVVLAARMRIRSSLRLRNFKHFPSNLLSIRHACTTQNVSNNDANCVIEKNLTKESAKGLSFAWV
jgi:hypothetical protein